MSSAPGRGPEPRSDEFLSRAVEASVRVVLVAILVVWCFQILRPFIAPVVWAAIIAVAVHPAHLRLTAWLGGRAKTSAVLLTLLGLLLLVLPIGLFAGSMVESAQALKARIDAQPLVVPPPPASVADWPLVGQPLYDLWRGAADNLAETLEKFAPQLKAVGGWLLSAATGAGAAVAQFLISLLVAGFFLASATGSVATIGAVTKRLAGAEGQRYLALAARTVRSVAVGILGVAVIQASLLGIGFVAVGLPHAGIWIVLCLGLGILQLPTMIVVLPAIIYVFSVEPTFTAIVFTVWSLLAGLVDNVLKPLLLGRGAAVPMLVIFLGAIGGFLLSGFVGLFVGAIVLSLGYDLLQIWVREGDLPGTAPDAGSEPGTAPPAGA